MGRQTALKTMEDVLPARIQALDDQIKIQRKAVTLWTKWKDTKKVEGEKLLALMHEHGLTHYSNDNYEVSVEDRGESIKVDVVSRKDEPVAKEPEEDDA